MKSNKCVIENCGKPQAVALKRGLCMSCYSKAKKQVEKGITWEQLAEFGLCVLTDEDDPFSAALDKALRKGS